MTPTGNAIRATSAAGMRLKAPARGAPFLVAALTDDAVILLFGRKPAKTRIPFAVLDEVVSALGRATWTPVAAVHSPDSAPGSVEAIIKPLVGRCAGNYVAALLQQVGLVDVALDPMRVRLR